MQQLSPHEQEIIRKGSLAADFMRHPCFEQMIKELQDDIAASIIATNMDDSSRREKLYMIFHALKELISKMEQYKIAKETIESKEDDSQD